MTDGREETYAYCDNDRCEAHLETAFIHPDALVYEEGRLATRCLKCDQPMVQLTTDDVREMRESKNYLEGKKREREEGGDR